MTDGTEPTATDGHAENDPLSGAMWMLGATTCFAVMAVAIRELAGRQNAIDIAFWRSVMGVLFMLPFMLRGMAGGMFKSRRFPLLGFRAILTYVAMTSYFFAIAEMSAMADAVALNATIPLFTVLLAVLFLPETVGWRRWTATAVGFAGAMFVLRPGFQDIGTPALLAVLSAVFYASAGIVVKILARTEPTARIVFYMNLFLLIIAAGPAAWRWNPPAPDDWPLLLAIGISGTLAHVCVTRAYRAADASFVAPFDFWRLVLVVLAGWIFFDDPGSVWTWVGGIIVFASAAYITHREARKPKTGAAAAD